MNPNTASLLFAALQDSAARDYLRSLIRAQEEVGGSVGADMTLRNPDMLRLLAAIAQAQDPQIKVQRILPGEEWTQLQFALYPAPDDWRPAPNGWWMIPDQVAQQVRATITDPALAHAFDTGLNVADTLPADFREPAEVVP